MDTFPKRLGRLGAGAVVVWLVVGTGLWVLGGPTASLEAAILLTLLVTAALWWVSGRFPFQATRTPGLLAIHAVAALAFGSVMVGITYSLEAAAAGTTLTDAVRGARFLGGEFAFWMWLYSVLAVGCYGIRVREDLRGQRESSARSEARLAEARLAALRGQLNPHFLFNALHTISALVHRDPVSADDAIERLGDILRFSLDDAEGATVELEDEVRFTRGYLDLVRLAMGDRLRATVEIDEAAWGFRVPPFSLQVLTENAVRHGVEPCPDGGAIRVVVRETAGGVELVVENDVGADATSGNGRAGGGLTNLRQRLDVLYGSEALLETGPRAGGGFRARVVVPRR